MFVGRNENGKIIYAFALFQEGLAEEWLEPDNQELMDFLNPPLSPITAALSPDQFYTMLENEGQLDAFIAAIETVTPTSKKLTCRNQFNNAQSFTWDMVLVTLVMPKAYGVTWETIVGPIWVNAYQTLQLSGEALETE